MSLPQATDTNNMSHVIIPAVVSASGPQFQQFPTEVLLEIFKYMVTYSPGSKAGKVVDNKLFSILNSYGVLHKLRKVSKFFAAFATQVFYETNDFMFAPALERWDPTMPAALPPVLFRGYLRRIHIYIVLTDYFFTPHPEGYIAANWEHSGVRNQIATVEELYTHCHGARQLRTLTDNTTGFGSLVELDLHIYANFCCNVETALAVTAAARFSVKAGKVQLTIEGASKDWHPELVKLIGVE